MKRLRNLLATLIAMELLAGVCAVGWRLARTPAPVPALQVMHPATTAALQSQAQWAGTTSQWRELGENYTAAGYFLEAEASHRVAAAGRPADGELLRQWAFALERCGELKTANDAYARAAQLDPKLETKCHYAIARNCFRQGDVPGGQAALARCGDLPIAQFQLARAVLREGQPAEAAAQIAAITDRSPEAQEFPRLLYQVALANGDAALAAQQWDLQNRLTGWLPTPLDSDRLRILAARERFGLVNSRLKAQRASDAGDFATAERLLDKILAGRADSMSEDLLATVKFYRSRPEESAELLEELLRRHGPAVSHWERLGDAYHALQQRNRARSAWLQATRLACGPPSHGAHGKLADSYQATGEMALSKRHLAWEALAEGVNELRGGNLAVAKSALQAALRNDPELVSAWYYLGETARRDDDVVAASRAYQQCLSLHPHHGRAADRLAELTD